jgi:hypothetical protein
MSLKWKLALWTPGTAPPDDGATFGCASHGIAGPGRWDSPEAEALLMSPRPVAGEVVAGRYAEVLAQLGQLAFAPRTAIVLFARATGMEVFLERWRQLFAGLPTAGGAAARGADQERGKLRPVAEDVAVLLITEADWQADSLNVHQATGLVVEFEANGPRTITRLRRPAESNWESAAAFLRARQAEFGRAEGDCESITFCDGGGRNLHVSRAGECLQTGADLPPDGRLSLRITPRAAVAAHLGRFCSPPEALVFACAGLRGLLDATLPVAEGTLVAFMYGEVVTLGGHAQIGNLMASRLVRRVSS